MPMEWVGSVGQQAAFHQQLLIHSPRPSLANGFNFFNRNFWSFGQQSLVAVRPPTKQAHPPKKFSSKEEKSVQRKPNKTTRKPMEQRTTAASRSTTSTTQKPTTDGPFRIALPTLNFPRDNKDKETEKEKGKRSAAELRLRFDCPRENEVRFQLFPKICKADRDCAVWQRDELCCDIFGASSCVSGVPKPLEETPHAPILGLIPRKCPSRPLAELWWDVQECSTDMDCWPRVCCPDGRRRYCRTSQPELETAPVPVKRSFDYLTEYLECTAPPPPIFDLHPKACTSTLDCFPNVCCQEAGLRHCRPPKKSVLTLMANFLNVDFVKRLAQNIVIK
uniref:GG17158 n=1 Tax=Drosophila erecta TaxID=7220 RepID=B3P4Q4_DROER